MATLVLGAVGAAVGSAVGGTVLGLSTAVIGRAVGAGLGRAIDQRLMGAGSDVIETGRIERLRLTGASEGTPVAVVQGRVRLAGQVIWATRFQEHVTTTGGGGGKGAPKRPTTRHHSYSVSLAIALCEGEIARVGRIWADGVEIAPDSLNMRVYDGRPDQVPDPKIAATEGRDNAPAYRGVAYVVIEDFDLSAFGNRVPQMLFEVVRPTRPHTPGAENMTPDLADAIRGVALMPGTGEYALATTPVHFSAGPGVTKSANINSPSGKSDFLTSVEALREELPECRSVLMISSWFGDDLRAGRCRLKPKVEHKLADGDPMPWRVSGQSRAGAEIIPHLDGRVVYGGTPADRSVAEAIRHLKAGGQDVVFYPFILMEQMAGNRLTNPWTGAAGQPVLPWRGRITASLAPGQPGSPDGTAAAATEVAAFFGTARPEHFTPKTSGGEVQTVRYNGPAEWSYRRFILHYAHLCAQAGDVSAFCIGSEMRGLTRIRGPGNRFPAVEALIRLATDVRGILGQGVRIGYAADWSEYFGYHPQDGSGDVFFHLDPLWADANIDFIGIDNYMPLSDWRDGPDHTDARHWGAIYDLDYLKANVAGGEGFDWYYASDAARRAQTRTPITDGAHNEPWVFRYKDLRGWWENRHHNRIGGVRQTTPTAWVPGSKPFWFTEYGCAAIDKGTNQPNKFLDPKSSESRLPRFSDGRRDDLIQKQYLRAVNDYWRDPANNPVDRTSGVRMVDMSRAHAWAWDARPYPFFPNTVALWSDGANYPRGHWLNGRAASQTLAASVAEICARSGVTEIDVGALYGIVRGYEANGSGDARSALQPLMLAHGFDAFERNGRLIFRNRKGHADTEVTPEELVETGAGEPLMTRLRAAVAEVAGRVRLSFIEADGDFGLSAEEAAFPDKATYSVSDSELPMVLTRAEARMVAERWLSEARVARDRLRIALPPSRLSVGAGDVIGIAGGAGQERYRIDHVEQAGPQLIEAVRVEPGPYTPGPVAEDAPRVAPFTPPVPVFAVFMDLPLAAETAAPHAPYLAVSATPWPGSVAVYGSAVAGGGYGLKALVETAATVGRTETALAAAPPGVTDRGAALRVRLSGGALSSVAPVDMLNGANLAAIGDGSPDNWEIFQYERAGMVGQDTYDLSGRLRGQFGSDALMPDIWPAGSLFVVIDAALEHIGLPAGARDLARHYRIGPAARAYDDPSYVSRAETFRGIGLRPYSPVHLRVQRAGGDILLRWVRRTRIDGDGWRGTDVPLGEATEAYLVRVEQAGAVVHEATVAEPFWTFRAAMRADAGIDGAFTIAVAQLSDRFGPGPFARVSVAGQAVGAGA